MLSALDFCSKTEKTMKDKPANQNPLRKEFQVYLISVQIYTLHLL